MSCVCAVQDYRAQRLRMLSSCGLQPRSSADTTSIDPVPYFVNLSDDATLSGGLVYPLPVGVTRIGRKGASKPQVR